MSAKQRRAWRQSIQGPFAPRRIEMLESPAYRVLSLSARRVIDRIEIELHHHGGSDNGKLPVTYVHFQEYGIHPHSIGPAIRECVALGFIEITQHGRGGNAEYRTPNKYRLNYRHLDRAHPTDEWKHIETMEQAETIARMARQSSYPQKTKTAVGKCRVSLSKSNSENAEPPLSDSDSTGPLQNPTVPLYLGSPVSGPSVRPRETLRGRLKDWSVRERVKSVLRHGKVMSVPELVIAARIRSRNAADGLLFKMHQAGEVERAGRGLYRGGGHRS